MYKISVVRLSVQLYENLQKQIDVNALQKFFTILFFSVSFTLSAQESFIESGEDTRKGKREVLFNHVDQIIDFLVENEKLTIRRIQILDGFNALEGYSYKAKRYRASVVQKPQLNLSNANTIDFWKMELDGVKAYYTIYLQISDSETQRFNFEFELEDNKWKIII